MLLGEERVAEDDARPPTLEELYREHRLRMVRLAYLLVGSEEAARDVVQDVFVRVHRRVLRAEQPAAYLRRAVVNACASWHRRRAVEERFLARRRQPEAVELQADELTDALAALPYRQRAALTLKFYEGFTEVEIAAALGCRPGTVGPLVSRGLATLRETVQR